MNAACWQADTGIAQWLTAHGMNVSALQAYYEGRLVETVALGGADVLFWQEVFQNAPNVSALPSGAIVSVWKGADPAILQDVVRSGLRAVSSGAWYLDRLNSDTMWGREWADYYQFDPQVRKATQCQK